MKITVLDTLRTGTKKSKQLFMTESMGTDMSKEILGHYLGVENDFGIGQIHSLKMNAVKRYIMCSFCVLFLTFSIPACDNNNPDQNQTAGAGSNWDKMAWDKGNWD